jgi:hypothetical protein
MDEFAQGMHRSGVVIGLAAAQHFAASISGTGSGLARGRVRVLNQRVQLTGRLG